MIEGVLTGPLFRVWKPTATSGGAVQAVALGLGANQGRMLEMLGLAVQHVRELLANVVVSSVYRTEPLHVTDQPPFLNAACTGRTDLAPHDLLQSLKHIERTLGRGTRGQRYGPRALDLDILLIGTLRIVTPSLIVPHARLRERAFALVPLAEIAPGWIVPGHDEAPDASVEVLSTAVGDLGVERTDFSIGGA